MFFLSAHLFVSVVVSWSSDVWQESTVWENKWSNVKLTIKLDCSVAVTMNLQHVFLNKLNQFATNVYNVSEAAHGDYIIHVHRQVDQEQAFPL